MSARHHLERLEDLLHSSESVNRAREPARSLVWEPGQGSPWGGRGERSAGQLRPVRPGPLGRTAEDAASPGAPALTRA